MKIGFSSFVLDQGQSGISSYVIELLKALQNIDGSNAYDILVGKSERSLLPEFRNNFRVKEFSSFFTKPIPNVLWHNLALPFLQYDVVHIPTIRRIPFFKPHKLIATIHDMAPFVLQDKYDPFRAFYHRSILSRCIRDCDWIIAVSEATKKDIIRFTKFPEEKIRVIYSGLSPFWKEETEKEVSSQLLKEKYGIKTPFFTYVSRIEHPAKNHIRLIHAFEKFKKRSHSDSQLVLAGADWPGASLVKQVAYNSSFASDILFLGYVSNQDVKALYSNCEQMIFPSLYEGFGFPILEALACGAHIACSNVSSLPEVASGYAQLFDPYDVDQIANAMETRAVQKKPEAAAYARSFSWEKTASQVLGLYNVVA